MKVDGSEEAQGIVTATPDQYHVVERTAQLDKSRKGWCTWHIKRTACCGIDRVNVYPAACLEIQCECGEWIETPLLMVMR